MNTDAQKIARRSVYSWIAIALLVFLFAVDVYRAATQSITIDEAYTFNHYVDHPIATIFTKPGFNNHPLNSVLAWISVHAFGLSEFTLRLPSVLLGGLLYFWAMYKLSRLLFGDTAWMLLVVAVNSLNPYLLDHLSAARGYGMGVALFVLATYLIARAVQDGAARTSLMIGAGAAMGLAVAGHMTQAFPTTALAGAFLLIYFIDAIAAGVASAVRFVVRSAVPLCGTALVVALVFIWEPLRHNEGIDGEAHYRAAFRTLTDSFLLYKPTFLTPRWDWRGPIYNGPWFLLIVFFIVLAGTAVVIAQRWLRAKRLDGLAEDDRQMLLFSLLALFTFLFLYVEPRMLHHAYFYERRLLCTLPVLFIGAPLWFRWMSMQFAPGRVVAWAGAGALAIVTLQFALEFNTKYYSGWQFDAGMKQLMRRLNDERPPGKATLGVFWMLSESANFYRTMYHMDWLAPVTRATAEAYYDYYIVEQSGLPAVARFDVQPNARDQISGMVLGKVGQKGRELLAELREAGYRGDTPGTADIMLKAASMEVGHPGAQAHLLRDYMCNADTERWCWTFERPAMLFYVPDAGPYKFRMDVVVHGATLKQTGPFRMTVLVNGKAIGEKEFSHEGPQGFELAVPSDVLRPAGLNVVETKLNKYYIAPTDRQKMGYLLVSAGFEK